MLSSLQAPKKVLGEHKTTILGQFPTPVWVSQLQLT